MDFNHIYEVIKENYPNLFSNEQIKMLDEINFYIDQIPPEDLTISEIDELKNDSFWKQLRILSREAILKLE